MTVKERISKTYLVPVVVIEDASKAVDAAKALLAGGVDLMEITLRTAAGLDAISEVAKNCPDMLVGAGTVLTMDQCKESLARGAKFIVSPGYDPEIVSYCISQGVDVLPGCVTPTEMTAAMNAGLTVVKFFPASVYGGIKAIKALSSPFQSIQFVPTGGVSLSNLTEYVNPAVFAIGGGWLCETKAIHNADWAAITETCAQSVKIVKELRG